MTLVEFTDDSVMDSVISSLTMLPDKIILLGEHYGLQQRGERILSLLRARGRDAVLECRAVPRGDVSAIRSALVQIAETEPELTFDLTGGEDLVLFAAGQISETYLVKGLVIDKQRVHPRMPKAIKNAKIALFTTAMENKKPEVDAQISIKIGRSTRLNSSHNA